MTWNNDNDDRPTPQNPWGRPQNNQGQDKNRGYRPQGNNNDPIDFEAFLRKARDSFGGGFGGGGRSGNPMNANFGRLLSIGAVILLVIWLLSGIYFVQPNQNAVVLTFGKYTRTDENPGPKWKIPWPVQSVKMVDVTTERRIQIGYSNDNSGYGNNSHQESLMLTGDENIVDIDFVVLWRVGNAKDFLYSVRTPEDTIAMVAASSMREIIGQTDIQPALTDARSKIQADVRAMMQKLLDEYHTGVTINNVQLQKVDPPAAVVDAFNEVQRARQEKEKKKNDAETYRNGIIPRAKGEAVKMIQDAEAYKEQVVSKATGEASRFNSVYQAYKMAPDVTSERMYLEAMEEIVKSTKTIVMGDKSNNVLPYLPLNELKKESK